MDNMNDLLSNCVKRQKQEINRILTTAYVPRDLLSDFQSSLDSEEVKVIIGPRRSGKSSLAMQVLSGKKFAYFNFEDESINFKITAEQLLESFQNVYPGFEYLLFDEIQLFPKWEHLINRLQRLGYKLIITGSNSKLLSGELASSLTGRYKEFLLLPFSFGEYLNATKSNPSSHVFLEYLRSGGFPSIVTHRSSSSDFLPALWDAIVLKDLVQRFKIRRVSELKSLLYLVLTNMGTRSSARSLSRSLNGELSHSTVRKFLSWASEAYLCSTLQQFSFKARERVNSDRKIYLYDNGFYTSQKQSGSGEFGKLLENYVFIELCRHQLVPNLNLFSFQTKAGYEVDFFIPPSTGQSRLIQVCYSLDGIDTKNRELRALVAASKELRVNRLVVICATEDSDQILNFQDCRIEVIPAWRYDLVSSIMKTK